MYTEDIFFFFYFFKKTSSKTHQIEHFNALIHVRFILMQNVS